MNEHGESYILATLAILLAIIIALIFSPRFINEPPSSGRIELVENVIKSMVRSEIANRTKKAFNYLEEYIKDPKNKELEKELKNILEKNNFLGSEQYGEILMKNIYNIKNIKFDASEPEYSMGYNNIQEVKLANLTSFSLILSYEFIDPLVSRINIEGTQSYYIELSDIKKKYSKVELFSKFDISFNLKDTYGPINYIEYSVFIFNRTRLEEAAYGFLKSDNGYYTISVLIRPEYYIMISNKKPFEEYGLVLVVSGSRGETLWSILKVKGD